MAAMMPNLRRVALTWSLAIALIGCQWTGALGASPDEEWRAHGRDSKEQRFSPLDQILPENISRLGLAWSYDFRLGRGVQATPLMVNGILYVTSAWSIVYALDARTGEELWVFDPEADRRRGARSCCDVVNRGVAYDDGKIFVASIDGRLIALDASTGAKLWDTPTVDENSSLVITGAPRVARGLVMIGNSGADIATGPGSGPRGYVSAYDSRTGELVWRFYTVPGNPADGPDGAASDPVMAMAAETWNGQWWLGGGGGTVWDSITYDEELDRVYIGVGNGSPWNRQVRSPGGGDNLFLASIVALDRATGAYVWHYQTTPGETWDHTATQSIILDTIPIDGVDRKVLMQAPKNGFFYLLDRTDGSLISAGSIVPMARAEDTPLGWPISWAYGIDMATGRPMENLEARFEDGGVAYVHPVGNGAHPWAPMAYDPRTRIAYFPAQDPASYFRSDPDYLPDRFKRASGFAPAAGSQPASAHAASGAQNGAFPAAGALVAWDVVNQRQLWNAPYAWAGNGGVLVTKSNLVFQATGDPLLAAYDATTGRRLWSYDIQASAQGGVISYMLDGEQYIAIATGNGGSTYLLSPPTVPDRPAPPVGRVLVFKLDANARLPALTADLPPFPRPSETHGSMEAIARGQELYGAYCTACHGINAESRRVLPDLRKSLIVHSREAFRTVVYAGAFEGNGMPGFSSAISADQVDDIRVWLIERGRAGYQEQISSP